jgi:hypothetical protein
MDLHGALSPMIMPAYLVLAFLGPKGPGLEPSSLRLVIWVAYVVPFGIAWGYWLRRRRSVRERIRLGLCRGCGYDLRASGEICPECGRRTLRG